MSDFGRVLVFKLEKILVFDRDWLKGDPAVGWSLFLDSEITKNEMDQLTIAENLSDNLRSFQNGQWHNRFIIPIYDNSNFS